MAVSACMSEVHIVARTYESYKIRSKVERLTSTFVSRNDQPVVLESLTTYISLRKFILSTSLIRMCVFQ